MAAIPREPRQIMINMMYLVLTALLALNVSAEILNAFHTVHQGISNSNDAIENKNSKTMDAFQKQVGIDSAKALPFYNRAMKAQALSDEVYNNISLYMDSLVVGSGGWVDKSGIRHTKGWTEDAGILHDESNLDVATRIMVEKGGGYVLQKEIKNLRVQLLSLIDNPKARADLDNQMPLKIQDEIRNPEGDIKDWTNTNFNMVPTIASVTILSKFQNDVRNSESQVISYLFSRIGAKDIPLDKAIARVIAPTSYVMAGQEYKADIFVAAFSSTINPEVYVGSLNQSIAKKDQGGDYIETTQNPIIGGGTKLKVVNGMGKYDLTAGGNGIQNYSGAVMIKGSDGTPRYYPFDGQYQVAQGSFVVSPDAMNVFYIGVDNPTSVSVPGFPADKVFASITQGSITGGNGKYTVRVVTQGSANVTVSVKMPDGSTKVMGAAPFRVKPIPDPTPRVGNLIPGTVNAGLFKAQQAVLAYLDNFVFNVQFPVIAFDLTYVARGQDGVQDHSVGGGFTSLMQGWLAKAKPRDFFYFENVTVKGPDGVLRKLPAISYKLN